ncbi:MAG: hypothetical protein LBR70_05860 [Lactobacillaceae bacterium]|jgi:hypothetical protein|nr:hypothetical protein [Lactobacillaceae bacterium]
MKKLSALLIALTFFSNVSYAQNADYETISVYADICEKIEPEETISQARVKASDKAVFAAVEKLPVLELPKKEFDQYDFNILVYKLVDNYIENLNVRTIRQDSEKVCVDVEGYIKGSNIISAVVETKEIADRRAERRAEENLVGKSPLQTQKEIENIILKEAKILPVNQGEIYRINEEELLSELGGEGIEETAVSVIQEETFSSEPKVIIQDSDTIIIVNDGIDSNVDDASAVNEIPIIANPVPLENEYKKSLVYITSTKFFDNSTSEEHSSALKNLINGSDYVVVTDNRELAEYIVSPSILRVKIDAINDITNRMQMVVMVEMDDLYDGANTKEHQNRFTLLSVEDDEQKVAEDLMNNLLEKAGSQILSKIELSERKKKNIKGLPKIITPASN